MVLPVLVKKNLDKFTILKKNSGRAKFIAGPTSLKSGRAMALRAIPIAHSMTSDYSLVVAWGLYCRPSTYLSE